MKTLKIFIGVVPDNLNAGGFDMIVYDHVNETQERHSIVMGDNARIITVNENTAIAFEHTGAQPIARNSDTENVLELVKISAKVVDTIDNEADNNN
jgi:hypothetical protein